MNPRLKLASSKRQRFDNDLNIVVFILIVLGSCGYGTSGSSEFISDLLVEAKLEEFDQITFK